MTRPLRGGLTAFLTAGLVCLVSPGTARAGDLAGRIQLPRPAEHSVGPDLYDKYAPAPSHHESQGPAPYAVVALVPEHGTAPVVERPPVTMDQNGIRFVPRIVPIQAGGRVRFLNSDPVFHNVFSLSPAKKFDLGRYPRGDSRILTFDRPGVVQVFCDIHAQMVGYIVVVESPYYGLIEPGGEFRLTGVAAGSYRVQGWSEGMTQFADLGGVDVPASGAADFQGVLGGGR